MTTGSDPAITVLMPVYNGERYLVAAAESILAQTFDDFEFVIVDDGSTDGSLDLLRDLERRDSRIRVHSRPNTGIVGALNDGLELARAPLVARMDADDIALAARLELQEAYLRSNPDCAIVGSRVIIIDPEGEPLREMGDAFTHDEIVDGLLSGGGQLVYHPSIMFRRQPIVDAGGYRERYPHLEDLDLFLRVAEHGTLRNLETPLLQYREHCEKIGFTRQQEQERNMTELLSEANERLGRPLPEHVRQRVPVARGRADQHRTWAWWALAEGHVATARKHAWASIRRGPLSPRSWRLLYCSIRGH